MLDTMILRDVIKAYDLEVGTFNRMFTFTQEAARGVLNAFSDLPFDHANLVDTPMRYHRLRHLHKTIKLEHVICNIMSALA